MMPSNDNKSQEHCLEKLFKRIAEETSVSPEEIASLKAELAEAEPITYESAFMDKNGEILVKIYQHLADGTVTDGGYTYAPSDQEYDQTLKRHGSLTPGQGHTIVQKLVNGEWVDARNIPTALV